MDQYEFNRLVKLIEIKIEMDKIKEVTELHPKKWKDLCQRLYELRNLMITKV